MCYSDAASTSFIACFTTVDGFIMFAVLSLLVLRRGHGGDEIVVVS